MSGSPNTANFPDHQFIQERNQAEHWFLTLDVQQFALCNLKAIYLAGKNICPADEFPNPGSMRVANASYRF